MKLIRILPIAAALLLSTTLKAQSDPVAIEIGNQKITKSELKKEFLQSIGQDPKAAPTACTYEKRQALEEYVELFTNYRLKLKDAESMRMDTLASINRELRQFRRELAQPYLIDSATLERILHEAYDRNHYALHASHILVKIAPGATPADTLESYNKAMDIYKKAIAGEDFSQLALKYSDDPSAKGDELKKRDGNNGDLGCFTVFNMVYAFESGAYSLQPGQISKPVRTLYGYHIIKLHERLNYFGKSTIQHIWISTSHGENAKNEIDLAYEQLQEGTPFVKVANNYSSDRGENGGFAADLELNQMPAEYVSAISRLHEGEYSKPFKTKMGWHIVRLVKKETIPSYEDMLPVYKQRLSRDQRNNAPLTAFAAQSQKKYGFVDYTATPVVKKGKKKGAVEYQASLDECISLINDSVYMKRWKYTDGSVMDMRPLFSIAGRNFTAVDLLKYIERTQTMSRARGNFDRYVRDKYEAYTIDAAIMIADSLLEEDNADFRNLMQEYRNGLMIFAYNDKMVWGKAAQDTAGLRAFYEKTSAQRSLDNPEDEPYFWKSRADIYSIRIADSTLLDPQKALKIVNKGLKKGKTVAQIQDMVGLATKITNDSTYESVIYGRPYFVEEGSSDILDKNEWQKGVYVHGNDKGGYSILIVKDIKNPEIKSSREARGYYVNDYQNYLEAELLKTLRAKYNVKIHQSVIDEITY